MHRFVMPDPPTQKVMGVRLPLPERAATATHEDGGPGRQNMAPLDAMASGNTIHGGVGFKF